MMQDAFITTFFCTGHVAGPNKVPACGCLLSHRPSDFAGERLPKVCSDAWGRSSPCHLHFLGSKHPDVCTRSSHHYALGMSLPQTKSLHVAVCFPTGRLILRGSVSPRSVLMHGVEAPPAIFIVWDRNIQMFVHVHHIIMHWACRCPKQRPCMWLFAFPKAV